MAAFNAFVSYATGLSGASRRWAPHLLLAVLDAGQSEGIFNENSMLFKARDNGVLVVGQSGCDLVLG